MLAVFIPLAVHPPALPDGMPLPRVSPGSVLARHAAIRAVTVPSYLDESYTRALDATRDRDGERLHDAQHDFVSFLVDARGNEPERRAELREAHLRQFLAAVDARRSAHPLVAVAERHELLPAPASDPEARARLIAWFDVRWELLAAREVLRRERVVLGNVLARLPRDEQLLWLRWAVSVDCGPLLGVPAGEVRTVIAIARCTDARRQFSEAIGALDASYPPREARAAAEVLQARALLAAREQVTDETERGELAGHAREAFERANNTYIELLAEKPTRMRRRYLAGTVAAMSR